MPRTHEAKADARTVIGILPGTPALEPGAAAGIRHPSPDYGGRATALSNHFPPHKRGGARRNAHLTWRRAARC